MWKTRRFHSTVYIQGFPHHIGSYIALSGDFQDVTKNFKNQIFQEKCFRIVQKFACRKCDVLRVFCANLSLKLCDNLIGLGYSAYSLCSARACRPVEQLNQLLCQLLNQLLSPLLNQLFNQLLNKLLNQLLNQLFNQPIQQVLNHLLNQLLNQLWNQLLNQLLNLLLNQLITITAKLLN